MYQEINIRQSSRKKIIRDSHTDYDTRFQKSLSDSLVFRIDQEGTYNKMSHIIKVIFYRKAYHKKILKLSNVL